MELRPIPGYESLYSASEDGQVWSYSTNSWRKSILEKRSGYYFVPLYKGGKQKTEKIHVLILLAFIGPKPFEGAEGSHKDNDKTHNVLDNLTWESHPENMQRLLGKMTPEDIREIRVRVSEGESIHSLARLKSISNTAVFNIVKRKTWTNIT